MPEILVEDGYLEFVAGERLLKRNNRELDAPVEQFTVDKGQTVRLGDSQGDARVLLL